MAVRLLIVDDDPLIARGMARSLSSLGYAVCGIHDTAEAALGAIRDTRPDLVIMDVGLAGELDGIAAAEELYVCEGTPVVIVSARDDLATTERAVAAGVYGFVAKPSSGKDLDTTIRMALAKHDELRRSRATASAMRAVLDYAMPSLVVTDGEGRIVWLSTSAAELLQAGAQELRGEPLHRWIDGLEIGPPRAGMHGNGATVHGARPIGYRVTASDIESFLVWNLTPIGPGAPTA